MNNFMAIILTTQLKWKNSLKAKTIANQYEQKQKIQVSVRGIKIKIKIFKNIKL